MASVSCNYPLIAFRTVDGSIVFADRGHIHSKIELPCGQCIECRLARAREWTIRIMHESRAHESSIFLTLTYDDEHMPKDGSLNYRHFQLFMKKLRNRVGKVRFFMCGEYGSKLMRPHYHAILFGISLPDAQVWRRTNSGHFIYRSALLESCWPNGFSEFGEVTKESAGYVARYSLKKVKGSAADDHYKRVNPETGEVYWLVPEFTKMSLNPGIGRSWIEKNLADVFPHDRVILDGQVNKPPRYYLNYLKDKDPDQLVDIDYNRWKKCVVQEKDSTPERRAQKDFVKRAQISRLKRNTF